MSSEKKEDCDVFFIEDCESEQIDPFSKKIRDLTINLKRSVADVDDSKLDAESKKLLKKSIAESFSLKIEFINKEELNKNKRTILIGEINSKINEVKKLDRFGIKADVFSKQILKIKEITLFFQESIKNFTTSESLEEVYIKIENIFNLCVKLDSKNDAIIRDKNGVTYHDMDVYNEIIKMLNEIEFYIINNKYIYDKILK